MATRTEDEILDELHHLDAQRQAIRARMIELNAELTEGRARATVAAMEPAERAALAQAIAVDGLASAEAVQ